MEHNNVAYGYAKLLTNLRILGALELSEYIYIKLDYNIKWRYSNSFINSCLNPLQTWGYTHDCLKKIYCKDVPSYITYLSDLSDSSDPDGSLRTYDLNYTKYHLQDLLHCLTQSIKGLEKLKQTYQLAYKNIYDEKFDTLIESYAKIQLEQIKDIIASYIIEKPKLQRQIGFSPILKFDKKDPLVSSAKTLREIPEDSECYSTD